jgi:hypothetical protein
MKNQPTHQRLTVEYDVKEHGELQRHHLRLCSNQEPEHIMLSRIHRWESDFARNFTLTHFSNSTIANAVIPAATIRTQASSSMGAL